jgi:polyisoprenoid-binding protein YceI
MTIKNKIIQTSILILSIFVSMHSAYALEEDLCAPFKNAVVDQSLIAEMLKAAKDGQLYQIKTNSSKMGFCVDSTVGMVTGNFQNFKGGLALKGANSQTMVSIDVGSLDSNVSFIEKLLKGDEFFNVKDFPELVFISSGFEWLSDTRAVLKGQLSMRGITKDVAFYVEITEIDGDLGDSNTILVKATTTVQRSEFGMSTLSSMVSDKVNLCMSVEAERYHSL